MKTTPKHNHEYSSKTVDPNHSLPSDLETFSPMMEESEEKDDQPESFWERAGDGFLELLWKGRYLSSFLIILCCLGFFFALETNIPFIAAGCFIAFCFISLYRVLTLRMEIQESGEEAKPIQNPSRKIPAAWLFVSLATAVGLSYLVIFHSFPLFALLQTFSWTRLIKSTVWVVGVCVLAESTLYGFYRAMVYRKTLLRDAKESAMGFRKQPHYSYIVKTLTNGTKIYTISEEKGGINQPLPYEIAIVRLKYEDKALINTVEEILLSAPKNFGTIIPLPLSILENDPNSPAEYSKKKSQGRPFCIVLKPSLASQAQKEEETESKRSLKKEQFLKSIEELLEREKKKKNNLEEEDSAISLLEEKTEEKTSGKEIEAKIEEEKNVKKSETKPPEIDWQNKLLMITGTTKKNLLLTPWNPNTLKPYTSASDFIAQAQHRDAFWSQIGAELDKAYSCRERKPKKETPKANQPSTNPDTKETQKNTETSQTNETLQLLTNPPTPAPEIKETQETGYTLVEHGRTITFLSCHSPLFFSCAITANQTVTHSFQPKLLTPPIK